MKDYRIYFLSPMNLSYISLFMCVYIYIYIDLCVGRAIDIARGGGVPDPDELVEVRRGFLSHDLVRRSAARSGRPLSARRAHDARLNPKCEACGGRLYSETHRERENSRIRVLGAESRTRAVRLNLPFQRRFKRGRPGGQTLDTERRRRIDMTDMSVQVPQEEMSKVHRVWFVAQGIRAPAPRRARRVATGRPLARPW